jgi:cell wall-associated NlpC family hydrolase
MGGTSAPAATAPTIETRPVQLVDFWKKQRNQNRMEEIVRELTKRIGRTPYVFSGDSIRGWDCSGMTRWVYKQVGVTIPHSADKQGHIGVRVSHPQVGDIVVFAYQGSRNFYHAALYVGNGMIINANRYYGTTVKESLKNFSKSQIRFIHLIPMAAAARLP